MADLGNTVSGNQVPDLIAANYYNSTISVLLGNGNGTFQPQVTYPVGSLPDTVIAADLTDGGADLVVSNSRATLAHREWEWHISIPVSYGVGSDPAYISAVDFDDDGNVDLAVSNYNSNNVSVLFGNGNGSFQPAIAFATGTNTFGLRRRLQQRRRAGSRGGR